MAEFKDEIPILYQLLRDNIHQNFLRDMDGKKKYLHLQIVRNRP